MDKPQLPNWLPLISQMPVDLNLLPGKPFDDAVLRIAQMDWNEFQEIRAWRIVFPFPEFTLKKPIARTILLAGMGYTLPEDSIRHQRSEWENRARDFFVKVKGEIIDKRNRVLHNITTSLRQHELRLGYLLDLDADKLTEQWLASKKVYTVHNMCYLNTYEKPILAFVTEKVKECLDGMGVTHTTSSKTSDEHKDSDVKELPHIYVFPEARAALADALSPFVNPMQYNALSGLINDGTAPEKYIVCTCKQVRIGQIFYDQVKNIEADKTVLARWLCLHFRLSKPGGAKNLSEFTLLNYLHGKGFAKYK